MYNLKTAEKLAVLIKAEMNKIMDDINLKYGKDGIKPIEDDARGIYDAQLMNNGRGRYYLAIPTDEAAYDLFSDTTSYLQSLDEDSHEKLNKAIKTINKDAYYEEEAMGRLILY